MNKPEPIRVGVEGIAPKPIELTPQRPRIEWERLIGLPPFQMYAAERGGLQADHILARVGEWVRTQDERALYADYCRWHASKGCWPGETPMGEVIK